MNCQLPKQLEGEIAGLLFAGHRAEAVKRYCQLTGNDAKEAGDFIESLETALRAKLPGRFVAVPAGKGHLIMIALLAAAGLVIALLLCLLLRRH